MPTGTRAPRALLTSIACGLLVLSFASGARAHLGHVILRAERYVKLDVAGRRARVVVSLTLGPEEGRRVLEAADTDGDGRVTEAERDAYLAQWAEGLATEVPVRVGSEPLTLSWGEGWLDPLGPVRSVAVTIEMVASFELGGGEETVEIEDRMVRREVYDRTDVAFRTRDGAELVASGADEAPVRPIPDLSYGADLRAGEPIVLRAILRTPEPEPRPPWPWIGAAVALLLLGAFGLGLRRRRR